MKGFEIVVLDAEGNKYELLQQNFDQNGSLYYMVLRRKGSLTEIQVEKAELNKYVIKYHWKS